MRVLQVLVIGMGVLIFVLLGVIVWRIATLTGGAEEVTPPAAATPVPPPSQTFGDRRLDLAPDCRIAATQTEAGRLIVRTTGPRQACDAVHVFDLATGAPAGTITP